MTEELILVTIITMVALVQNGKRVNMKQLGDHDDVFLHEVQVKVDQRQKRQERSAVFLPFEVVKFDCYN